MTSGTVNLETCDQEPIHLIGAIQPHGALIAIDETTLIVEFASTNTASFLGAEPSAILGKPLAELIGDDNARELPKFPLEPSTPELLRPWFIKFTGQNGKLIEAECLPHRQGGLIILEFVEPEPSPAPVWEDELLRRGIISELVKPGALTELADASAKIIRDVTGFDRVMIYKFAEDKHGEVIAESTTRPDSFLGLHYPASDIPDPARRHFVLNVMRSIPDICSEGIPIISRSGDLTHATSDYPLDLTFSKLRAVAPVHIEYLSNMGVGASLSISLITNNELWGLVACHHYGPRLISSSRLRFAELLGGTVSALLQSIENTKQLEKSIEAEKIAFRLEQQARDGINLRDLILDHAPELMRLLDANGVMLSLGGDLVEVGTLPSTKPDFSGLRTRLVDGVFVTSHLSSEIPMDEAQMQHAAGAAFLDLSGNGKDFLVFSRRSFDETIKWAGKPEKVETKTKDGISRLSPRGSFALWREERHGKSRPFDVPDKDALRIIRRALFALNSLEHERAARDAQQRAEAEKIRLRHALLDAARTSSMGELASAIAHELSQPLSAISNYVSACQQEFKNAGIDLPERAEELINEAARETARAGDLVQRVRNFISRGDLNLDHINLNDAIKQGADLALLSCDLPNLKLTLALDQHLPKVVADPVQIGQVVLNLVRNAVTSMQGSIDPSLTINVSGLDDLVQVSVRDTGPGIPPDQLKYLFEPFHGSTTQGMGIGLSLCRSIIEAHGGRIWANPSAVGAEILFQIPIPRDSDDDTR